jgi:hypothetical protein
VPGISIVWEPVRIAIGDDIELVVVPYQPGQASEWFPIAVEKAMRGAQRKPSRMQWRRVLLTHLGIWDEETPSFMKSAHDAVGIGQLRFIADAHDIDSAFAGNWHAYKDFALPHGRAVIPGTLVPNGFQEDQRKVGRMMMYGSDNTVAASEIIGPRWYTLDLRSYEGLPPSLGTPQGQKVYVRLLTPREKLSEAMEFKTSLEGKGSTVVIEPVGEVARIPEITRMAVAAAGGQLDESFAELAKVDAPGTKEGVLARLAAYRKACS